MRRSVFPKILRLALLYCAVFIALVTLQFAKRGGFTQRVGSFVVSGQYRLPGENEPPPAENEYFLDGDVHVFFGGMDFGIVKGVDGRSLYLTRGDGGREEALPESMIVSENSVKLLFSGGTELEFLTHYAGGSLEMRVSGLFDGDITGIELPFSALRKTNIRALADGQFIVNADGRNYSFGRSPVDAGSGTLRVESGGMPVTYRAIPEQTALSPADFVLPAAQNAASYDEYVTRWRAANFSLWNRTVSGENNEDLVAALAGEALVRGTYKAATAAVSPAFLRAASRGYESSVYLGGLVDAARLLAAAEREKLARLSRQINEESLDFLFEPHVFEYFAVRGNNNFIEAGADLVRAIDPAVLALDITPGILEGYMDWKTWRLSGENPFEPLVDQACFVVTGSLRKTQDGGRVFAFNGNRGETEFNLRLGKALSAYAQDAENDLMTGIGRSLIVSALSMGDSSGVVNPALLISDEGEIVESPAASGLTTAGLHRILSPVDTLPRAFALRAAGNNVWAWTAARALSAVRQNDVLDISVTFPEGESHYMIIRGIRPFVRLQLYGVNYRTDPQFERYDSSGWGYIPQEQTLILKMRHRTQVERVRIIFREDPPAQNPPASQTPAATAAPPAASQTPPAAATPPAQNPAASQTPPAAAAPPAASQTPPASETPAVSETPETPETPAQGNGASEVETEAGTEAEIPAT